MEDVGRDYLAKIKTTTGNFKVGGVYWCGTKFIGFDTDYRMRHGIPLDNGKSSTADTYPSTIIPAFTDQKKLLIVRGGIGDLLALSILQDVAEDVTVVTSKSLFHVLDWWKHPPKMKHFNEPLFNIKYPQKIENVVKEYGQQVGDHIIAQGSPKNWYEIISDSVGKPFLRGKPLLKPALKAKNRLKEWSILVVHKATSVNRTADLKAILAAIPEGFEVYWYDNDRRINSLGGMGDKTTIKQFFADLYYADFVISVDTSAIHFREGIGKPALGLYSSFTAESRTKYYQFTQSIDIKSGCPIQPCFYNQRKCPIIREGENCAPCLGADSGITEQVREKLKEML
jgi:hypothetical protein